MKDKTRRRAPRILVVDTLGAILVIVREFLEGEGFVVLTAESAWEAVRIAADDLADIDLLLTDVRAPGMDGFALAGRLKIRRPTMAIIIMSAVFSEAADKKRMEQLHALFLWKPFTKRELVSKVNRALVMPRT